MGHNQMKPHTMFRENRFTNTQDIKLYVLAIKVTLDNGVLIILNIFAADGIRTTIKTQKWLLFFRYNPLLKTNVRF